MQIDSIGKQCNKCLKTLSKGDFYPRYGVCKTCSRLIRKEYYQNHKEHLQELSLKYYQENKDVKSEQMRVWRNNNKLKLQQSKKVWKDNNKERVALQNKAYRENNRAKINAFFRKYAKERYKSDPLFKLSKTLRVRMWGALKKIDQEEIATIDFLGCSVEELKKHLESKFKPGMTWDNYGLYGWHIDHIDPLALATNSKEMIDLFHYTNLQPLWAEDNLSKGDKIDYGAKSISPELEALKLSSLARIPTKVK